MAEPYIGEIKIFACGYAPQGWAKCDGSSMQISQNAALNALLGNTYGGDLKTYFNLPDMRGRSPLNFTTYTATLAKGLSVASLGNSGGAEAVTLNLTQIPGHNHIMGAVSSQGDQLNPTGNFYAGANGNQIYGTDTALTAFDPVMCGSTGGGAAHDNMQPFVVLNFCIATSGVWPPRQ